MRNTLLNFKYTTINIRILDKFLTIIVTSDPQLRYPEEPVTRR